MRLILGLDQLCRNAHAIAIAPDVSFDEVLGAQRPPYRGGPAGIAVGALYRCAREDTKRTWAHLRQLRRGFFSQSISKFVARAERQYREPHALSCDRARGDRRKPFAPELDVVARRPYGEKPVTAFVHGLHEPGHVCVVA